MVTLRSHTLEKTRRSSWAFLPQEIRRMILEEISRQRRWGCASAVCKEWHALIVPKNLNRLELNRASAEGLKTIILQRHLIRRIHLNIELPSYACRRCQRVSGLWEPAKLIKKALRKLFGALETWEPTDRITLELNVYSPSDPDHWFKNHLYGFNHEDDGNLLENYSKRSVRRSRLERFPNVESIDYEPWRVLCHSLDENGLIYGRHDLMMQVLLRKLPQHVRISDYFRRFQRTDHGGYSQRHGPVHHQIERVEDEIISHGDAIYHLRLPDGVIDPTSLRQICQEGTLQREAWAVEAEPSGWT
uniref:F-box domain-containing protein n=1 Tax=Fusarium oxysporum (strain Fo5176) TaxID=660025 RepID=A0A0D2XMC6_FUSOF